MELQVEHIFLKETMENKLKLNKKFVEYLVELPENGMGYQLVDLLLTDGKLLRNRIVLNSTFLKLDKEEQLTNREIEKINLSKE
jgi:hypothetical protein